MKEVFETMWLVVVLIAIYVIFYCSMSSVVKEVIEYTANGCF